MLDGPVVNSALRTVEVMEERTDERRCELDITVLRTVGTGDRHL
jgi:hypothetical protein